METQKIVNLLNASDNENSKFATKNWYVIDSESKSVYSRENPIKFLTCSLESSLCDYSDAYVLVTGNIAVVGADNNTKVALKNSASFIKCITEIKATCIDEVQYINIAMPMYSLIEYSDDYSDASGSIWQFKRDEIEGDVTNRNGVKVALPLKHLSNFWRSLEMPLINCKVELSLSCNPNCVLSNLVGDSTITIIDANLYVPIVTLSAQDNAKLSKLLSKGFNIQVYWNKYKIIPNKVYDENDHIREMLHSSYQGVKRLFGLAYRDCSGANRVKLILTENIFFQELKQEIATSKLMEETFMISQLMT